MYVNNVCLYMLNNVCLVNRIIYQTYRNILWPWSACFVLSRIKNKFVHNNKSIYSLRKNVGYWNNFLLTYELWKKLHWFFNFVEELFSSIHCASFLERSLYMIDCLLICFVPCLHIEVRRSEYLIEYFDIRFCV